MCYSLLAFNKFFGCISPFSKILTFISNLKDVYSLRDFKNCLQLCMLLSICLNQAPKRTWKKIKLDQMFILCIQFCAYNHTLKENCRDILKADWSSRWLTHKHNLFYYFGFVTSRIQSLISIKAKHLFLKFGVKLNKIIFTLIIMENIFWLLLKSEWFFQLANSLFQIWLSVILSWF